MWLERRVRDVCTPYGAERWRAVWRYSTWPTCNYFYVPLENAFVAKYLCMIFLFANLCEDFTYALHILRDYNSK
jgi:hypothetical protein